ncbi:glycosaminoglycan xylosylkinase homolog isoform X2 [Vanessa atalanta]|uniref:glycosaminoglycan xylosylkinase homolog isoform X2 n=1 Tax=Vanessa atalanta TaxID=42275 RepID=UPI001FCE261B|nr:glycosaminoglycan xylosylkinase homolog isoform X2 [Vanessa atalanta]
MFTMSMNYAFGFSLFLLVLVALNIFFFYTLNTVGLKSHTFNVPSINIDLTPSVFKEIYDYLNYLPNQYKSINSKFALKQKNLISSFNTTKHDKTESIWSETQNWISEDSLFPHENGAAGKILHAIQTTQIALVDNAPKGTQLKLLLLLEGKQKIFFKPKRYNLNHVVNGNIYAGFDRHNSEVFAYYLAMVLNFRWIAPSIIRRIHLHKDIVPFATMGLKKTMIKNDSGSLCIYGKCFYCRKNETVCPDQNGEIEGAAILYLDKQFKIHKSPWRRSYSNRKMEWEIDNAFCKISPSTWQKLEMVSGGSLTNTIKQLAALQGQKLATEEHFKAVERRLLKVFATVQYCIGKYSRAKVLKNWLA